MDLAEIEKRKKRHIAFWNREDCERPLVLIHLPRPWETEEDRQLEEIKNSDLQRFGSEPEILLRRAKQIIRRTEYLGDALPVLSPPLGPLMLSAFLGAKVEIAPNTVWFHSPYSDLADLKDISLDFSSNRWWKIVEESVVRVANEPQAIPASWSIGSLGDNLACLVGAEKLMFDMMERPELVKAVLRRMLDITKECFGRLFKIALLTGNGTANWLGAWTPKKTGILENDFSIMLSTEMYQEFFAEEFKEMSALYDYRLFHVDGTRSQQHIDPFLAKIPGLHGCQLGSDPGTPAMKILPVIRSLQAQGKCVYTYAFPDEVETLFEHISPRGVCIVTVAGSSQEAQELIDRMTRACTRHRSRQR